MNYQKIDMNGWSFYLDVDRHNELKTGKCGKWMYFFDNSKQGVFLQKRFVKKR